MSDHLWTFFWTANVGANGGSVGGTAKEKTREREDKIGELTISLPSSSSCLVSGLVSRVHSRGRYSLSPRTLTELEDYFKMTYPAQAPQAGADDDELDPPPVLLLCELDRCRKLVTLVRNTSFLSPISIIFLSLPSSYFSFPL